MLLGQGWHKSIVWNVNSSGGVKGFVTTLLAKLNLELPVCHARKVTPMKLLEIRRAHWGIETGSHYRRDVTLREDATRFTIGYGARVMANLNNLILALIRQAGFINAAHARRFFSAHLSAAFSLLVTPFS